ncbi:cytokine receptor-like factor 3, partial [Oncorhynchus keta]|uniref:cytokine receptor-like factor 3 n=1 Tax=Oncorhynchus keta TaxID=8018 RepID=UPI00227A3648
CLWRKKVCLLEPDLLKCSRPRLKFVCVCFSDCVCVCVCVSLTVCVCVPEWCPGSEGYILSSRRNIAMRSDSSPSKAGVLYSNAPTYFCGQTLTFKISATGQVDKRDSIGVCVGCEGEAESLQRDQAVCISTNGAVFVNGKEMTNQLPSITLGSAVTFDMEVVNLLPISNNNNLSDGGNFKLRVTIGSGNREVVFDWLLDQGVDCLFFGCSLAHPGWKVLVF